MIEMKGVSKTYPMGGEDVAALSDVSLKVEEGSFLAVTGPSGSGKSTLLYTMGGLLTPTSGDVVIDGVRVYGLSPRSRARFRRENVGFVFQTFELLPYLTAIENVMLPLSLVDIDSEEQEDRAFGCLEKVGLAKRADHKPTELSGGEQQRVAVARGIVNSPRILLADEPTGNLDQRTGQEIIGLLRNLHGEGLTIVMVTHDVGKAEQADVRIGMMDGQIISR